MSIRLKLFYKALDPVSSYFRKRRAIKFVSTMNLKEGSRIIDLGGSKAFWDDIDIPLNITIVNLPDATMKEALKAHHKFQVIQGDACDLPYLPDSNYDLAFSNSVIEHVGDAGKRAMFANEIRRLGKAYWVQTPAIYFPIEAHSGVPFWFFFPENWRKRIINHWAKQTPDWSDMIKNTTVVSKREMKFLFPEGSILTERFFGIPKSYILFSI